MCWIIVQYEKKNSLLSLKKDENCQTTSKLAIDEGWAIMRKCWNLALDAFLDPLINERFYSLTSIGGINISKETSSCGGINGIRKNGRMENCQGWNGILFFFHCIINRSFFQFIQSISVLLVLEYLGLAPESLTNFKILSRFL